MMTLHAAAVSSGEQSMSPQASLSFADTGLCIFQLPLYMFEIQLKLMD
jgi:hypothetical protein